LLKKLKNYTVNEYCEALAAFIPVPGGGSAAALTGVIGVSLLSMAAHFSRGSTNNKADEKAIDKVLKETHKIRKRLLDLVDLDAQAYQKVVNTRKASQKVKAKADQQAQKIPLEVCRLCYRAVTLAPILVKKGNRYLLSDVQAAAEILLAAFNAAMKFTA